MVFGNFVANDKIDLTVAKNSVHAIIGENGAGKTTLMSILFGLYQPTSGTIKINGKLAAIRSPLDANRLGIGMVHQHFKLVDTFTVFENVTLNSENTTLGFITQSEQKKRLQAIVDRYGLELDLKRKISQASVVEQQRTEILKILARDADILILDEPTAVLTPQQIDDFLAAVLNLKAQGKTIVIISHKLDELRKVADRATIIRRGKVVKQADMSKLTDSQIVRAMVGAQPMPKRARKASRPGPALLKIENLEVKKLGSKALGLRDFSLSVRAGEIVAICGIEGNGQQELVNAIAGLQKVEKGSIEFLQPVLPSADRQSIFKTKKLTAPTSEVALQSVNVAHRSVKKRYDVGLAHIPSDRHKWGLVLDMNVFENAVIQDFRLASFSRAGFFRYANVRNYTKKIVEKFDVRTPHGISSIVRFMSGGNQQKLIVGRELSRSRASILLVSQPTRGLDIGAINKIHQYILEARQADKAVLLVSYELDEILALADQVVVVNHGTKVDQLPISQVSRQKLGQLMTSKALEKGTA